jgi:hypothetical protein
MSVKPALLLTIGLALAGCVAPEEPAPAVRHAPAASAGTTAAPQAGLEPAPIPNRRMGPPTSDSVVRIQQ